jgi:hypothetical protein
VCVYVCTSSGGVSGNNGLYTSLRAILHHGTSSGVQTGVNDVTIPFFFSFFINIKADIPQKNPHGRQGYGGRGGHGQAFTLGRLFELANQPASNRQFTQNELGITMKFKSCLTNYNFPAFVMVI